MGKFWNRAISTGAYASWKEAWWHKDTKPEYADVSVLHHRILHRERRSLSRSAKVARRRFTREYGCGIWCKEHPPARARNRKRNEKLLAGHKEFVFDVAEYIKAAKAMKKEL